jgi:hypothetical protein
VLYLCACVIYACVCGAYLIEQLNDWQVVLQVSVAVLVDNFVAASARMEAAVREERLKVFTCLPICVSLPYPTPSAILHWALPP